MSLLQVILALGLMVAFFIGGIGVGRLGLRWIRWSSGRVAEEVAFSFGLGAGILSLALLYLGLARLLYALVALIVLLVSALISLREWAGLVQKVREQWATHVPFTLAEKVLGGVLVLLVVPVLFSALLPPTDVDALVYHLVAPRLYLQQHSVVPSFDNIGINYPIATDILYVFGLAAGSDITAQLIHFSFAAALTVGIFGVVTQYASRRAALLAMVIFWASPVIGLEASAPLVDLGWTFYEFLAIWAFLRWREARETKQLLLVGVALGFSISNKYLGAVGVLLFGALIAYESVTPAMGRIKGLVKNELEFGLTVAIVALPWYLKNWVWLGDPMYPFLVGSVGLGGLAGTPSGLDSWVAYGVGHDLGALLLFPWNVFVNWQAFDAAHNRGGPTLLFLFLPFYLLVPKRQVLNLLWLICVIRFAFWWNYTQSIRYLLVLFPVLAILGGYTIDAMALKLRLPIARAGLAVLVGILCVVAIGLQFGFLFFLQQDAIPYLAGELTRAEYLRKNVRDYASTEFINAELPLESKVLAIGNARTFYAQRNIAIDDSKTNWLALVENNESPAAIREWLKELGFTHVWVSQDDLTYYQNFWDIDGQFAKSLAVLDQFKQEQLELLYKDENGYAVYRLSDHVP